MAVQASSTLVGINLLVPFHSCSYLRPIASNVLYGYTYFVFHEMYHETKIFHETGETNRHHILMPIRDLSYIAHIRFAFY